MDVKSPSGRQRHNLILFSLFFLARKFLLHLIRSSDPTSVPCIRWVAWIIFLSLSVRSPADLQNQTPYVIRHIHTCTTFISSLCLVEDKERRKRLLYAAFWILNSCIFLSVMCHILCAYMGSEVYHHFQSMGLFLILFHPSSSDSTCSTVISSK